MRRIAMAMAGMLLLGACAGTGTAPLQVADEHPGFAHCALYTQASLPDPVTSDGRASALQACLADTDRQVAAR